MKKKLFRDANGAPKNMLSFEEGISYQDNPLDFFILLARYKFASRFLRKNHTIIDVGCGKGNGSVFLAKQCKKIIAVDYDKDLIQKNTQEYKNIKNLHFERFDLLKSNKKFHEKFDALVSMDVIEHFDKNDLNRVVKNYASLIKKNGFAVIGTPNIESRKFASKRRLDTHPFEFNSNEFEKLLLKHFKNVFLFTMTDEIVSTCFPGMSWYLIAICTK
jgi:2-polyprenyl-3-methyl-5-hydroxy-6-metoxy-1,4-benzoquinol methylase